MGHLSRNLKRLLHHCLLTVSAAASIYAETQTTQATEEDNLGQEMVKGLALGFGLFFGIIIVLCVVCCLCCNNNCHCCCCKEKEKPRRMPRRRVGPSPSPSPPRSGTITRSTIVSNRS